MSAAYFEAHPTDPDKVIFRKRPYPYCQDTPRTWVGLTDEDMAEPRTHNFDFIDGARWAEAKLKEKNT